MSELLSVTRGLKVSYIQNNKKKKKSVPTNHPVVYGLMSQQLRRRFLSETFKKLNRHGKRRNPVSRKYFGIVKEFAKYTDFFIMNIISDI